MGEKLRLCLLAPAKINWALAVTGKRADGYHELHSLMQNISVYDRVELSPADEDCCQCSPPVDCAPANNLALRAWHLLKQQYALEGHLQIRITKDIPSGGGLAGGSADAAAVLLGVNILWGLGLSVGQLAALAFPLGADIPFCLYGGLAEIKGAGEIVTPYAATHEYRLLLAAPPVASSTAAVFAAYDQLPAQTAPADLGRLLSALQQGDSGAINAAIFNMLEPAAFSLQPEIKHCREILAGEGFVPLMSGSGSCVFALSQGDVSQEERAMQALLAEGIAARMVHTLPHGVVDK